MNKREEGGTIAETLNWTDFDFTADHKDRKTAGFDWKRRDPPELE